MYMAWLALGALLSPLRLSTGSFPKPLTAEEEQSYLERSANGDLEARNILVERNLRLVAHIMKKYYASESEQEDLISIGTIGLIKAVSSYRMDKNIRLATYASRCIENAIPSPTTLSWERCFSGPKNEGAGMSLLPISLFQFPERIQTQLPFQRLPGGEQPGHFRRRPRGSACGLWILVMFNIVHLRRKGKGNLLTLPRRCACGRCL